MHPLRYSRSRVGSYLGPHVRAFLVACLAFLWAFPARGLEPGPATERNGVLISWDGAGREPLKKHLAEGKLPHLARLIQGGALVDIEVAGHQTDTKAGHAQLLTGYDPKRTGVFSNGEYGPIPPGYTIFERLHQSFGARGITTIMLTGKDHNLGSAGPGLLRAADPYHLSRSGITIFDGDKNRPARNVGTRAVGHIRKRASGERFFLFIHFADVDANGHRHGEGTPEYDRAMVTCDEWLGAILDELEVRGLAKRTLVWLTADHGFVPGTKGHGVAPHIFLATNDPTVRRGGEQRDVAPTVLSAMGVDIEKIKPPLAGKPLTK